MQPTLQQWLDRKPAGRKPKKPVKKRSAKRQRAAKEYTKLRKMFLMANPKCEACRHIKGTAAIIGNRPCHDWSHTHPSKARELGLLK